jgi:hypothetical protein
LMVGTPGSLAQPHRGPAINHFALMVGAFISPALPPKGPTVDIFCVHGGRS